MEVFKNLIKGVWGEIYADKGYISKKRGDYLKNDAYLVHTRHKAIHAFFANTFASIAAYQLLIDKPNANFEFPFIVDNHDLAHALAA